MNLKLPTCGATTLRISFGAAPAASLGGYCRRENCMAIRRRDHANFEVDGVHTQR
jgi:hypothetical protein